MDFMIGVVTIALIAFVLYTIYTTPPSSGCLSADAADARDKKKTAVASQPGQPMPVAEPPATAPPEPSPAGVAVPEALAGATVERLCNPVTGETAAVPTNYRFAKKWIKEALVAEGLLDKVYASNELDATANEKVKAALRQLRTLTKYHA